ncbi:3-hydroxyacyl-ACP dehydratase [Flavobacterium agricola]|uniref:3-hydroxyacyl-ACP dehydratase n=1 Tax=Flavobacterium agricola TaxID=2870839 RepID=A0ABY6LZJ5_9FLAO|nr:3-hydroxyacyl-ACP dehydratase [Flavobacterium agricola]UYW00987.1 3-hydroxyacyl-ACP dehydratase [Flavobacterium agricola]
MLFPNLYHVEQLSKNDSNLVEAVVVLNPAHEIFSGHFPNNPVLPGVCMMQIIKEITEQVVAHKLSLVQSNNIKFMALINPEVTPILRLELEINEIDAGIKVKNTTYFNDVTALKLSSTFKIETV